MTPERSKDCSTCHEPLSSNGICFVCLLRDGLEEAADDRPPFPSPALNFGDFEIAHREDGSLWELGRGAMGVTYRAVDRVLHRAVALKVINPVNSVSGSHAVRERFLREARAAATLRHANIAGIFQFGASAETGSFYYAMELVEGETLEALVRRNGPLDVDLALDIASQIAAALAAAAARGLIHRDIKPGNLMLSGGGPSAAGFEVKVIDFGLAKAAAATAGEADLTHGGFVGTPAYASPEQFDRDAVDARSDIYSLGVTLWYALTGHVPFTGRTLDELRDHPGRIDLPVEQLAGRKIPAPVIALLRNVLAVAPADRPASARALMAALETCRSHPGASYGDRRPPAKEPKSTVGTRLTMGAVLAIITLMLAGIVWWIFRRPPATVPHLSVNSAAVPAAPIVPEKSLAVLPFDNFSEDKDSAFFADGVQDGVLTDLSKVADLKVISRTSVMLYKDPSKRNNLREIGKALGVSYVVEGSVQRVGNRIRVTAQLIDARTDAHRWAEQYDRDLADVFAIQSDVARSITAALQAKLASQEQTQIESQPPENPQAYLLYLQANALVHVAASLEDALHADKLYTQAIALGPRFAPSHARASMLNSLMYSVGRDPLRKSKARALADESLSLAPNLGEAHLALGLCCYRLDGDCEGALRELSLAGTMLPNESEIFEVSGSIYRRQGHWREALAAYAREKELDPLRAHFDSQPITFRLLREWKAAEDAYKQALQLEPRVAVGWAGLAYVQFVQTGSPAAAGVTLDGASDIIKAKVYMVSRWEYAMMARDFAAAEKMLPDIPEDDFPVIEPRPYYEACIALVRGDRERASALFEQIRPRYESSLRDHPDDPVFHAALGKLYALLGRKEDALHEARRAVELCPESKDALDAPVYATDLAIVYAQCGEEDQAISLLIQLLTTPAARRVTLAHLRLSWEWDPLRQNPQFKALLDGPEPKTTYQ